MTTAAEKADSTMFHYLLEMHRDGKVLMRMELNVPIEAFPAVRMNSLLSLESMLLAYGRSQGFIQTGQSGDSPAAEATP